MSDWACRANPAVLRFFGRPQRRGLRHLAKNAHRLRSEKTWHEQRGTIDGGGKLLRGNGRFVELVLGLIRNIHLNA